MLALCFDNIENPFHVPDISYEVIDVVCENCASCHHILEGLLDTFDHAELKKFQLDDKPFAKAAT